MLAARSPLRRTRTPWRLTCAPRGCRTPIWWAARSSLDWSWSWPVGASRRSTASLDPGGTWTAPQKKVFGASLAASVALVRTVEPALPTVLATMLPKPVGRTALLAQLSARPWALPADFVPSELPGLADARGAPGDQGARERAEPAGSAGFAARPDAAGVEGVGFEPTVRVTPHSGFQDRRHRPLGEPSRCGPSVPAAGGRRRANHHLTRPQAVSRHGIRRTGFTTSPAYDASSAFSTSARSKNSTSRSKGKRPCS